MFVIGGKKPANRAKPFFKDELNVRLWSLREAEKTTQLRAETAVKTLGPKYGSLLGAIRQFLATCNGFEVVKR